MAPLLPATPDRWLRLGCAAPALLGIALSAAPAQAQAASGNWRPVAVPAIGPPDPSATASVAAAESAPPRGRARRAAAAKTKRHAVTVYAGKSIPDKFSSILYQPWNVSFENTYLAAVAVSTRIWDIDEHLSLELEANVARRFGDAELWEFAAALFLRWDGFPWNDVVYTTVGLGLLGPSYATEISDTERNKSGNSKGSKLLNFFVPEITLSPPDDRDFAFVARIHHRSGVFGLFHGVSGGSNFLSLGVRHRF